MADINIGVVGLPGKWSTETLADAVEYRTGKRLVIDMSEVVLDLHSHQLHYQGRDLCELDALIVKKISREYSPHSIDRLELLRAAEAKGVRVFSPALSMLRISLSSRIPPPTVSGINPSAAIFSTVCTVVSRASWVAVMSRKVISSAPCWLYFLATSTERHALM